MSTTETKNRVESLTGVKSDHVVREFGAMSAYHCGSTCARCKSLVSPGEMVPLIGYEGPKTLTCPHCGADLINLRRD